jgi:futalosine hydrolase
MHILIVSATHFELKPLLDHLKIDNPVRGMNTGNRGSNGVSVDVLITGIGMVNTAYAMGRYVHDAYDLIINAGVCGAFDPSVSPGTLLHVTEDVLSEMGAEDGDGFLTYDQMGLPGTHRFSGHLSKKTDRIDSLKQVKGITVNTVHGRESSIAWIKQLYKPDVESMEGAAFFAACEGMKHVVQIRSVSNHVEKRDKSKWQMPLAIKNLNDFLIDLINEL